MKHDSLASSAKVFAFGFIFTLALLFPPLIPSQPSAQGPRRGLKDGGASFQKHGRAVSRVPRRRGGPGAGAHWRALKMRCLAWHSPPYRCSASDGSSSIRGVRALAFPCDGVHTSLSLSLSVSLSLSLSHSLHSAFFLSRSPTISPSLPPFLPPTDDPSINHDETMGFKNSISLPLEAGSSVLDVHVVPPRLQAALEYVAARLARKSLALDLVLVRRDYQLPSVRPPFDPPASPPPPTACSTSAFSVSSLTPQQPGFAPVSALRQLARTVSRRASDPIRRRPTRSRHGSHASLASLPATLASLPATLDSLRRAPSPVSAAPFGVCLVHDPALSPRARKILCGVLAVAEQKFGIG